VYSKAGAEVSVAATKSFVAQLCALYQLALSHPAVDPKLRETLITELLKLPADIEKVFDSELKIMDCARYVQIMKCLFYRKRRKLSCGVGRGAQNLVIKGLNQCQIGVALAISRRDR